MPFEIILYPDSINLSGNLKPLIISTEAKVSLSLTRNGVSVFSDEVYNPDHYNRVTIELDKLIGDLISYSLPSVTKIATSPADQFVITIDNETVIEFSVIKGGVDVENLDAPVFLKANWLTWQPQSAKTTYNQPQWLRYYADTGVNIKVKAYFEDQTSSEKILSQIFAGLTTVNAAYPVIAGEFDKEPQYYDLWVEDLLGTRLSYVQRYIYSSESYNDDYFVFQNTLGGFDSVRLTGEKTASSDADATRFRSSDTDLELRIDYSEVFKKNTGYIDSENKRKWVLELFKSSMRYVVADGLLRRIVINNDPKLDSKTHQANSYEFQYALAKQSGYLNLERTDELPEVLEIESVDGLFFLEPRLLEFPVADIEKDILIPIQHPYEKKWRYLTFLAIMSAISKLTADQLAEFINGNHFITEEWLRENYPLHDHKNKAALDLVNFDFDKKRWDTIFDIVIKNILLEAGTGEDANKLFIKTKNGLNAAILEIFKIITSELVVKEIMSSEEFISGFPNGKGWALMWKDRLNATEVLERRSYMELDEMTVRGVLRVYEFVISQLLGENGTRLTTDMMRVLSIDTRRKRIYLDTEEGVLFNPFRTGDILMVQQYNPAAEDGYITRQYELQVTGVGIGSPGPERIDWITYKNFVGDIAMVKYRDTLTRVDSATNPDRKGLIKHTSIEPGSPFIDIIYGLKTDPENSTKSRYGRLSGIISEWWGQLQGYGLFSNNAYLLGDFRLRTGENILTRLDIMEGLFRSAMQQTTKNLTDDNNYLMNATFVDNMTGWEGENEIDVYDAGGELLNLGMSFLSDKKKLAEVTQFDGRPVVRIKNSYIRQANQHIRRPETEDTTLHMNLQYRCNSAGTLSIGFENSTGDLATQTFQVTPQSGFTQYVVAGVWDGTGDFVIRCTGDVYIENLSLTDRPLEEYKKEVSSLFEKTEESILGLVRRVDYVDRTIAEAGWITTADGNRLWASITWVDQLGTTLQQHAAAFQVVNSEISGIVTRIDNVEGTIESAGFITQATGNTLYAKKEMENGATIISTINQAPGQVYIQADKIKLEGVVTANNYFKINLDGSFEALGGTLGGFTIKNGYIGVAANPHEEAGGDVNYGFSLSPQLVRYSNDKSVWVGMGDNVMPATMGNVINCSFRVSMNTAPFNYVNEVGNVGMLLDVKGKKTYDDLALSGNHAIYCTEGYYTGFRLRTKRIVSHYTLSDMDNVIFATSSSGITITLPLSPKDGQLYFIRKCGNGNLTISGNGKQIMGGWGGTVSSVTMIDGRLAIFTWDHANSLWMGNYMNNF